MATKSFDVSQTFKVGDIVLGYFGGALKIVARPFVDEVDEYRFILVSGTITNNKFVTNASKELTLQSTKDLRSFKGFWTKDVVVSKGDAFTDKDGNVYVAEDANKAWNMTKGTWARLTVTNGEYIWDGNYSGVTLTPIRTVAGQKFSKYLG